MLFFGGWIFIFYNESKIWNETSKKGLKSIHIAGERILVHGGKRHDQKKAQKVLEANTRMDTTTKM